MNPRAFWGFILGRLTDARTWGGLTVIASNLGYRMAPEYAEAISAIGLIIAGALLAGTKKDNAQ